MSSEITVNLLSILENLFIRYLLFQYFGYLLYSWVSTSQMEEQNLENALAMIEARMDEIVTRLKKSEEEKMSI